MLAKHLSLKVIKVVILFIDTYKQDMIEVGNWKKTLTNGIIFNHIPMQSLLGVSHCVPLFYMAREIWLEDTKELNNEFSIGYVINPTLKMNK